MNQLKQIGNRKYIIENKPIINELIEIPIVVIWNDKVLELEYTWYSGWEGTPENKIYGWAKLNEFNNTKFFHVGSNECYKVLKTDSKTLCLKYNLDYIND